MQSSLGVYIGENIIKYAKLQKDKDVVKVDAYNIAFYDNNLDETLKKIISETYSYKTPISINVSDEIYSSFLVPSLLGKQDIKKAIDIEYEEFCSAKGYNKISLDHRYILVEQKENPEKKKALSVIANKSEITKRLSAFDGNRVTTVSPMPVSITNLVETDGRENYAIVNIEDKTQITTVIDGQLYQVDILQEGMKEILDNINKIENSYSKSYEVCKNMTIYTQNAKDLYSATDEYMDIVTTTLYKIAAEVKRVINEFFSNVDKIYISGLGTCINNIDLFFQEYIPSIKCEILKPYFINTASVQLPIKDYIEVNSAIALALDGLGMIKKEMNFAKGAKAQNAKSNSKVRETLNAEVDADTIKFLFTDMGRKIKKDFTSPIESVEKLMIRGSIACLITAGLFVGFSTVISNQLDEKTTEVSKSITTANAELTKIGTDISMISSRTVAYQELIDQITNPVIETPDETTEKQRVIEKDSIPNLLNRIMFVIPKKVKLISIKNTKSNHIVINAEAEKYEQLGYFKAVLSTNGILKNVKSTPGDKTGNAIQVTIEGDLP